MLCLPPSADLIWLRYLVFQLKTHAYLYDDVATVDDVPVELEEIVSPSLGRGWALGLYPLGISSLTKTSCFDCSNIIMRRVPCGEHQRSSRGKQHLSRVFRTSSPPHARKYCSGRLCLHSLITVLWECQGFSERQIRPCNWSCYRIIDASRLIHRAAYGPYWLGYWRWYVALLRPFSNDRSVSCNPVNHSGHIALIPGLSITWFKMERLIIWREPCWLPSTLLRFSCLHLANKRLLWSLSGSIPAYESIPKDAACNYTLNDFALEALGGTNWLSYSLENGYRRYQRIS